MKTLGSVIKNARESHGITQAELSKVIGISRSSVAMYEKDQREPQINVLKQLSEALSVPLDVLMGSVSPSERRCGE